MSLLCPSFLSNNANRLNIGWLRDKISVVEQTTTLFSGTIFENIAIGCHGANMEDVIWAAKLANAHDFISAFPLGLLALVVNCTLTDSQDTTRPLAKEAASSREGSGLHDFNHFGILS